MRFIVYAFPVHKRDTCIKSLNCPSTVRFWGIQYSWRNHDAILSVNVKQSVIHVLFARRKLLNKHEIKSEMHLHLKCCCYDRVLMQWNSIVVTYSPKMTHLRLFCFKMQWKANFFVSGTKRRRALILFCSHSQLDTVFLLLYEDFPITFFFYYV